VKDEEMSKRISSKQWTYFRSNNPGDLDNLDYIDVNIDDYKNFIRRYSKKRIIKTTNRDKFGDQFGKMLDWIEDNCNDPFYAKLISRSTTSRTTVLRLYFFDQTDAMAFKLMVTK
jgi:hypothetical protein